MATKSRNRKPLTKERVLERAIALADRDGVEGLSMRRLGQALGVEAMSLYNHVANKAELVGAMVDRVIEQFELPEDEPRWDRAIRRCAISAHDLLIEHPWACGLALVPGDLRVVGGPRIRYMEWLLRRLREAGFSAETTYHAYHVLDAHIIGFSLWASTHGKMPDNVEDARAWFDEMIPVATLPYLHEHGLQHLDEGRHHDVSAFEYGLDLLLESLDRSRSAG
jgi:AcrR family transcriptional regulator